MKETGHIVEIQITLEALLVIKKGGGHAVYKLARLLELNAQVSVLSAQYASYYELHLHDVRRPIPTL